MITLVSCAPTKEIVKTAYMVPPLPFYLDNNPEKITGPRSPSKLHAEWGFGPRYPNGRIYVLVCPLTHTTIHSLALAFLLGLQLGMSCLLRRWTYFHLTASDASLGCQEGRTSLGAGYRYPAFSDHVVLSNKPARSQSGQNNKKKIFKKTTTKHRSNSANQYRLTKSS